MQIKPKFGVHPTSVLKPEFLIAMVATVLLGLVISCGLSEYKQLSTKLRASPPEQWHAWAANVIDYTRTNGGVLPRSQWPQCVRDAVAGQDVLWNVLVMTNELTGTPYVWLDSPGGFESIGVLVGSESFVPPSPPPPTHTEKVYPGVYLQRTH